VLVNVWLGAPAFLSSFQMVLISCSTDFFASLALVYEPAESDLLLRPPRNIKKERMIDWKLMLYVYGFLGVFDAIGIFLVISSHLSDAG
jgi:sodium/potassium-transporting ATPase subunit alpha